MEGFLTPLGMTGLFFPIRCRSLSVLAQTHTGVH